MATFQELRDRIIRQNGILEKLKRRQDAAEAKRLKYIKRLQAACPHRAAVEIKGEEKYPGEKTFSVHYRVCLGCGCQESMRSLDKLGSPRTIYRTNYSDRHAYEILGRKLA